MNHLSFCERFAALGERCQEEVRKVQNPRRAILFLLSSRPCRGDFPGLVLILRRIAQGNLPGIPSAV